MVFKKHTVSKISVGIFLCSIFVVFCSQISPLQAASTYYFNNAINTDPTELGNYWNDADQTDPALQLPDFSVDSVSIVSDAVFDGDAIFNNKANNNGTVNGDAFFYSSSNNNGTVNGDAFFNESSKNQGTVSGNGTFYNDQSVNNGTVEGTKTRYFTIDIATNLNFVLDGPWTVIADGVVVDVQASIFDSTTTFTPINGGSFIMPPVPILQSIQSFDDETIILYYDYNQTLDSESVPDTSDYILTVNGSTISLTDVSISEFQVTLSVSTNITPLDTVTLSYTAGTNPIRFADNVNAGDFTNEDVVFGIHVGIRPEYSVVVGTKLYVDNASSSSVTVIDTTTDSVVATISVGASPQYSSVLGNKVYISNYLDDTISVIDTTTDSVIATISVGTNPLFSYVIGTKLYVVNSGGSVSVIDTTTNNTGGTVVATISVGNAPFSAVILGTKLYVNNSGSATVSVIDTTTNNTGGTVVATIPVGDSPEYATAVGTKVYVSNTGSPSISVIDTTTNSTGGTVVETITGSITNPYASISVGTKLYVTGGVGDTVSIINTLNDTILTTLTDIISPYSLTVLGNKIFVNRDTGTISPMSVIDAATDTVITTISVGNNLKYSTVVGNKLYVGTNNRTVSVIATETIESLLPNLTSFSSTTANGTYSSGQTINITANFGRSLKSGSTMSVALNSGGTATLSNVSGSTLSGTYTVGSGQATPDLQVSSITSANVTDSSNTYTRTSYALPSSQGDFEAENSFITRNIGDSKNIAIGSYLTIPVGDNPYQVSAPINGYLYVANQGSGTVSVIRQIDNTVTNTISVGSEPYGLATATISGTTYLYVANTGSDTVSVINTSTNIVAVTVSVGVKPYYVTAIGTNLYVTNGQSNTVSVINANNNTVTATIPVGLYPRGIKAYGTDLYVANYGDPNYSGGNSITVINSLDNSITTTILLPAGSTGPRGVTVLGDKVYVANYRSDSVSVINTGTNTITATIPVGAGPRGIVGVGSAIYVENFDDGTISIIDTNSNTVTTTVDVGHSPAGMGVSGTDIYFSRFQDNVVSIFDTLTNTLIQATSDPEPSDDGGGGHSFSPKPEIVTPSILPMENITPAGCFAGYFFSPLSGNPCPVTSPKYFFLRDLMEGSTGADVQELQKYLNIHGIPVSTLGPGSPGSETTFFGLLTKAALIKFQEAHRLEILLPVQLLYGTGFFGPFTRAYINRSL